MSKIKLTNLFKNNFKENYTLTITKTNESYIYFKKEYKGGLPTDTEGNLLISVQKQRLIRIKKQLETIIERGTPLYNYFKTEYRQNSPMEDEEGNILLSDDIVRKI